MTLQGDGSGSDRGSTASDGYLPVTVICGDRRLDVALPSTVPWADLQPSLLRLLLADRPPPDAGRWVLTPVGRADLALAQTLASAGILQADVLVLHQGVGVPTGPAVVHTVRDQLEDIVDGRDRFWRRPESLRLTLWTTTVGAGVLLVPIAFGGWSGASVGFDSVGGASVGAVSVGVAGAVAVFAAVTAVVAARNRETICAAACLTVGCGWAGVAGIAVYRALAPSGAGTSIISTTMLAVGSAAALLLAGCCVVGYAGALAHTSALLVAGSAAAIAAVAVRWGAPAVETACTAALLAVLAAGVMPRAALAINGVSDGGGAGVEDPTRLTERIARADRMLTGAVVGLSVVAVAGAMAAARSENAWYQAFGGGIGLALLLRSRVFTQIPHVLAPRIGALAAVAGLWFCAGSAFRLPVALLILGPMVGLAIAVTAVVLNPATSPVANARIGRALDLAELTLVVVLVVWAAGLLGLADAVSSVLS